MVWWPYMTSKRPKMTIFMICECDKTLAMASFEIRGDSRHGPQGRIRKCCIQSGRPDGSVHWATPYRRRPDHQPYHHHQQHQSHRTKNTTTKKPYSNKMLINGRTKLFFRIVLKMIIKHHKIILNFYIWTLIYYGS